MTAIVATPPAMAPAIASVEYQVRKRRSTKTCSV